VASGYRGATVAAGHEARRLKVTRSGSGVCIAAVNHQTPCGYLNAAGRPYAAPVKAESPVVFCRPCLLGISLI